MTELLLLRHGVAMDPQFAARQGIPDEARPLTDKGRRRCRAAARGLARLWEVPLILTSPLLRAKETAEIFAEVLSAPLEVVDWLCPGRPVERWFAELAGRGDHSRLMLVGHEPELSTAIARAVCGGAAEVEMKKAACALLRFPEVIQTGAGQLSGLLPPRVLRMLGEA